MATNKINIAGTSGVTCINSTVTAKNINVKVETSDKIDWDLPELIKNYARRDKEFKQLENLFFNADTNKVVICGIPGIGKSELAKQFATKCQNEGKIQKIYWIPSEKEDELKKSWLSIKQIYETSEKKKTLFILDNGISRQKLSQCNFQMPNDFFFIITSQIKNWGEDIVAIKLSSLDPSSAIEFYEKELENVYTDNDRELLLKVANFVGFIPLGLQITAAGIREYNTICGKKSVQIYLEELETSEKNIIVEDFPSSSDNPYGKPIYTAIQMSLKKIEEESGPLKTSITLDVLYFSSYLDSELLLYEALKWILGNNKKYVSFKKIMLDKALATLDNFSLVTFRNGRVTMHRFTQEILRYHFRTCYPDQEKEFYESCLEYQITDHQFSRFICFLVIDPILQHIDATTEPIVIHFFEKYGNKILVPEIRKAFEFVFHQLIKFRHTQIFKKIFDNAGALAKDYIIECELLQKATIFEQSDIVELIQNYLDKKDSKNIDNNRTKIELAIEFYKYRLKEIYNDKYNDLLGEIANIVGCNEVGLEITAAGVRQYRNSYCENCIKAYLEDLKKSQNSIIGEDFPYSYDKVIYGAVKLALKKIEAATGPLKSSFTLDVLYVCLLLDYMFRSPDNLQFILRNTIKNVNCDKNMLKEALDTLHNFSLVTLQHATVEMNSFIQNIIRYHYRIYNSEKEKEFLETFFEVMLTHDEFLYSEILSSVLQRMDTTIEPILTNFLEKHKSEIQNNKSVFGVFQIIFERLVRWGHVEFIKKIFNSPGYCAKSYITDFNLLQEAEMFQKPDIVKLFQNYLDNATDSKSINKNHDKSSRKRPNTDSLDTEIEDENKHLDLPNFLKKNRRNRSYSV